MEFYIDWVVVEDFEMVLIIVLVVEVWGGLVYIFLLFIDVFEYFIDFVV